MTPNFKEKFPDRFIECGIAEQDMVSQAGTIALTGLVPIVHSFACFLVTRASEQIYNNASQKGKVKNNLESEKKKVKKSIRYPRWLKVQ